MLKKGKQTLHVATTVIQAHSSTPCIQTTRHTFMLAVTSYNHVALSEVYAEMCLLTATWDTPLSMG